MKIAVFDFDGVIADSTNEVFIIALHAWHCYKNKIYNFSNLNLKAKFANNFHDFSSVFSKYRKYVRWPREYYFIIQHIINEKDSFILTQKEFNIFNSELPQEAVDFEEVFFKVRNYFKINDYNEWIQLFLPWDEVINIISSLKDKMILYVLTGRDSESVYAFLQQNNILLQKKFILDLKQFPKKKQGIEYIIEEEKALPEEIIFLDDNILHLEEVRSTRIHLLWARWGYICPEHENYPLAKSITHCALKDLAKYYP
ncbi:MAG: HAD family hydrolase [Silvanigrellaceae bacterium]|nr:HAD family hydrolase [Silvanigrellaceae bacterium]